MLLSKNFRKGFPVLPIGSVNLTTGRLAKPEMMTENIFEGWEPGGFNILIQEVSLWRGSEWKPKMRVLHSSGNIASGVKEFPIGGRLEICHDQTHARMGETWEVVGVFQHEPMGLIHLKTVSKKSSLSFATFK